MVIFAGTKVSQYFNEYEVQLDLPNGIDYYGWTDYNYSLTPSPYIPPLFEEISYRINELFKPEDWRERLYSLMLSIRELGLPRRVLVWHYDLEYFSIPYNSNIRALIIDDVVYQDIEFSLSGVQLGDYLVSVDSGGLIFSPPGAKVGLVIEYGFNGPEFKWIDYLALRMNLELALASQFNLIDSIQFGSIRIPLNINDYIKHLKAQLDRFGVEA